MIESTDISAINAVGLVICLAGISLHVIRKASMVSKPVITERRSYGAKRGQQRLLSGSESDSDSEMELFHTSGAGVGARNRKSSVEVIRALELYKIHFIF